MSEIIIEASHVVKEYQLGAIGGKTLRGDLQSRMARLRHREDPNSLVGSSTDIRSGERFRALDDVSFTVEKGEALGIIGHNGAGKSTLLKLLSRVTAPTSGEIGYDGRIASMLEVGTGFHPELSGRENIYLNGAILGMTKAEIDSKFEEIVRFAEMEKFIDTPVKRYSSGMYVKLAFAVAAHLDSEILVMDEVLAVGDMKFQQKCLGKMGDVSANEGKTILYVSHNMNTIRSLCSRCLVLDHGKLLFDGGTEEAIAIYSESGMMEKFKEKELLTAPRYYAVEAGRIASFTYMKLLDTEQNIYKSTDTLKVELTWEADHEIENTCVRFVFWSVMGNSVASSLCLEFCDTKIGKNTYVFELPLNQLVEGIYDVTLVLFGRNEYGASTEIDVVKPAFSFEITENRDLIWSPSQWGCVRLEDLKPRLAE